VQPEDGSGAREWEIDVTNSPLLVTGGTGTLGSLAVPLLREAGCRVRSLSRGGTPAGGGVDGVEYVTGDLLGDKGIAAAVEGVRTVLHLAGGPKGDEEATRNLVRASERAGVRHLVLISVVAADRVPLGYFRAKLGASGSWPGRVCPGPRCGPRSSTSSC
jgi:uncharacterized protein YbjT (DUF2867 family)